MVACLTQTVKLSTDTTRSYRDGRTTRSSSHSCHMVRVVFAVPVASSKSERVFSVVGRTVTAQRASMAPEKVEDVVTVNTNIRLLRQFGLKK